MAEDPRLMKTLVRLLSEGIEEGTDQYAMAHIREQRKKEREAQMRQQGLLAKQAGGANFPPVSGPTITSGITTSSQREEKIKRAPPLPSKEDQPLGTFDIDKVASFLSEVLKKGRTESTVAQADNTKKVFEDAVFADRKHRILEALTSGAIGAGLGVGIPAALAAGPKIGLKYTAIGGLLGSILGGTIGGVSAINSRKRMSALMHDKGIEGIKSFIEKRNPATSGLLSGALAGSAGAGLMLALKDRNMNPFPGITQEPFRTGGKFLGKQLPTAISVGSGLVTTDLSRMVADALHTKTSSQYDDYSYYEEEPELPADRYSTGRQGLLYATSMLHPTLSALAAGATAHPDERFDQFGRTLVGGLAGDVVGGLTGAAFGGPAGFGIGSVVGRPLGTYIAQHIS